MNDTGDLACSYLDTKGVQHGILGGCASGLSAVGSLPSQERRLSDFATDEYLVTIWVAHASEACVGDILR
jgi:hypothetical protein